MNRKMLIRRTASENGKVARTYPDALRVANAAGRDAANRQMLDAGRSAWSEDDWNVASETCGTVMAALGFDHLSAA